MITLLTLAVIGLFSFMWRTYDVVVNKYPQIVKEQELHKQYINENTKLTFTLYISLVDAKVIDGADTEFLDKLRKRYDL